MAEATAYFTVSEALTNVAKYAQATHATVRLANDADELVIEVQDDGIGGAKAGTGSGLSGLADRVGAIDGSLSVTSPARRGHARARRAAAPRLRYHAPLRRLLGGSPTPGGSDVAITQDGGDRRRPCRRSASPAPPGLQPLPTTLAESRSKPGSRPTSGPIRRSRSRTRRLAAKQQDERKELYGVLSKGGEQTFGGASFDPVSGVLKVFATNREVAEVAGETGKQLGLNVETRIVERSFADLERQAKELRARKDTLGSYARSYGGIETENNRFVIAVTPAQAKLVEAAAKEAGVTLIERLSTPKTEYDAGCTSRSACDWTIRAGSMIWNPSAGNNNCSVGFTARTSANARYTYTAGHCSSGATLWGTGGQSIGPLSSSRNSGPVDAAIIPVTNPWFTFDSGGEIYNEFFPNRSVAVNSVAPTLSSSGPATWSASRRTSLAERAELLRRGRHEQRLVRARHRPRRRPRRLPRRLRRRLVLADLDRPALRLRHPQPQRPGCHGSPAARTPGSARSRRSRARTPRRSTSRPARRPRSWADTATAGSPARGRGSPAKVGSQCSATASGRTPAPRCTRRSRSGCARRAAGARR